MLIFPALGDRLIVLATGLVMLTGLAYVVNMMRKRDDRRSGRTEDQASL